jgi:SAM-dependent methyltransferase
MSLDENARHWEEAGKALAAGGISTPTTRDPFLGELEERNFLDHLETGDHVLEVGVGDGAHTVRYAQAVASLAGIDVAESLLEAARDRCRLADQAVDLRRASVLDIESVYGQEAFDCVISQRCLINLPDWEHQVEALRQIAAVLKPGGRLLLTEGFDDGLAELNAVRVRVGLAPITTVAYNTNFGRHGFEQEAQRSFEIVDVRDYGLYLVLSRVFHPLAVRPEEPHHASPLNQAALELASALQVLGFADVSYCLFYALRKSR